MSDQARFWPLSDFDHVSEDVWRRVVESSPATAAFERKMFYQALEGFAVPALGSDQPVSAGEVGPLLSPAEGGWRVRAEYSASDLSDLVDDLAQGGLDVAMVRVGEGQLAATAAAVAAVRALPLAKGLEVCLCVGAVDVARVVGVLGDLRAARADAGEVRWQLNLMGALLRSGEAAEAPDESLGRVAALGAPRSLLIDTSPLHDAGADAAAEVAFALSGAVWHLRALTSAGASLDDAARMLAFGFSVDSDLFMQASKLRAVRLLWARCAAALGVADEAAQAQLDVQTSRRMLTRFDPWCNVLRGTLQVAAAVIGGADSVLAQPFDALCRPRSAWGRRVARNTQLILREESRLHALIDLGGGSGQVEAMTAALCERGWGGFQQLEREGGFLEALRAGDALDRVAVTARKRAAALAKRQPPIIGVSDFPDLTAHPLPDDALLAATTPWGGPAVPPALDAPSATPAWSLPAGPLPCRRDAEPFERLRLAVEARHADAPSVWALCLGPLAQHLPRLNFTTNLLAVAGLRVEPSEGVDSLDAAQQALAALESRSEAPRAVVLCGPDALYPALVPAIAAAFRGRTATLWLAGRPSPDLAQAFIDAGIDGAFFLGCDVPDTLTRFLTKAALL
jgi:methylmalonyl-CoA mutase